MDWEVPLVSEAGYGIDDREIPASLTAVSQEYENGEGKRHVREWCNDLRFCDVDDCKLTSLFVCGLSRRH